MNETSAAMAVLDIGNRADEDIEMETEMQVLRREVGEGFAGVHLRLDELRRETTQRIDLVRQETADRILEAQKLTAAQFAALDVKMELTRRESSAAIADSYGFLACMAKIDDSRKEASDNFKALSTSMLDFHRETTARIDEVKARIDAVITESQRGMERSDAQFRWVVGLMISSLLATAGLFARAAHML